MREPKVIILMAGMGSRLGKPIPKCLMPLNSRETILSRQLRILRTFDLTCIGVVGFKKDLVMEADPNLLFVYNPRFDTTNTAKSLLCALRHIHNEDVLWLNGDVVFDPGVIARLLKAEGSLVAVNNARVAEEEVKYTLDGDGFINAISKQIPSPLGEALGINLIESKFLAAFKDKLAQAADGDYFERGMELLIQQAGGVFRPTDVGDLDCLEVDFKRDLDQARRLFSA